MALRGALEIINELRRNLSAARTASEVVEIAATEIEKSFGTNRVAVNYLGVLKQYRSLRARPENGHAMGELLSLQDGQLTANGAVVPMPLFVSDTAVSTAPEELLQLCSSGAILSFAAVPVYRERRISGWIECVFSSLYYRWHREDAFLLQQIADYVALFAEKCFSQTVHTQVTSLEEQARASTTPHPPEQGDEKKPEPQVTGEDYKRLLQLGSLLVVGTDTRFVVTEVVGDTEAIFGLPESDVLNNPQFWRRLLHREDYRSLARKLRSAAEQKIEVVEEVRTSQPKQGSARCLLLKAVPHFDAKGELSGWKGFGFDITEKRRTEQDLLSQNRRIEALFEVSRALQLTLDPALVTLRGLRAVIGATGSHSGFACFYDQSSGSLELVAAEGLSPFYLGEINRLLGGKTLVRYAVEKKQGLLIGNIQYDPRAAVDLARQEGLRSAIVVPLMVEEEVVGAIAIFCRESNRFIEADFELVSAAARQVGLAIRQAELYLSEKRQVNSLSALYRLSHELSKYLTAREIAQHAFPIIQEEISCKRMWLGVLNDAGSHIVGQAGIGPGVRAHLIEMQIELDRRHDFFDEALQTRRPVIVKPGQPMECSGLNKIMQKLNLGTFIIVPLVGLGQVVGVLVVEPAIASSFFAQKKLPLLSNMANEIATVMLARRFESKMAEAEKMRMAGVLAAGVAHNFNNLLQAVMGQASLIEMQVAKESVLSSSAKMIIEAAGRGAALIKQLLTFATPADALYRAFSPDKMLSESAELYKSVLGSGVTLEFKLGGATAEVVGDYSQVQQVITNLLVNAKEATMNRENGYVRLSTCLVRLRSGEVDPELAPGSYVRIDIEDNGAGMDAERAARCFEPFFTTKNVDARTGLGFSGSGLGLASAYSIVKHHQGIVTVTSAPNEGTLFSIYLPVAPEKIVAQSIGRDAQLQEEERFQAALVCVEDSVSLAIKSALESIGLVTKVLIPGQDIEGSLGELLPNLKLVVVDLDRVRGSAEIFLKMLAEKQELRIIAATLQMGRWSTLTESIPQVTLVEKPIGVWTIQSISRRLFREKHSGLHFQVERLEEKSVDKKGVGPQDGEPKKFAARGAGHGESK